MSRQHMMPEVPRGRVADREVVEARTPPEGVDADSASTSTAPRRIALAASIVAVAAAAVAGWALMRPAGGDREVAASAYETVVDPTPVDDAKGRLCEAFDVVRDAVAVQTNTDPGPDPVAKQAVAANARLATVGGGGYLLARLSPAIAPELATAVRSFADDLQEVGMYQLAGVPKHRPPGGRPVGRTAVRRAGNQCSVSVVLRRNRL